MYFLWIVHASSYCLRASCDPVLGCFSCNKKTELCIIVVKKGISRRLLNIVP